MSGISSSSAKGVFIHISKYPSQYVRRTQTGQEPTYKHKFLLAFLSFPKKAGWKRRNDWIRTHPHISQTIEREKNLSGCVWLAGGGMTKIHLPQKFLPF